MNTTQDIAHPPVASKGDWLEARMELLAQEKEYTRMRDRVNAQRRRLPMVKVEKEYLFEGAEGQVSLRDLFGGKRQLIVHHVMFGPDWKDVCPGCSGHISAFGDMSDLGSCDTRLVEVSRAPYKKIAEAKVRKGWNINWYSSFDSDFNYDYHVSFDENKAPVEYNFKSKSEMSNPPSDELPGFSVFFMLGDDVYHTYSAYARGLEDLTDSYNLLDLTPYGRQQDFEDSPAGWPQKPTYG